MHTKPKLAYLIIILFITSTSTFSQVSDSLFELSCQHEDIIILSEEMEVNIVGLKILYMNAYVSNTITYVVRTKKGLLEFQPFVLPKEFDELHIYHSTAVRNIDWAFDYARVTDFSASLVNNTRPIQIDKNIHKKRVVNDEGYFGHVNQYQYFINSLIPGDTIQISYKYEIEFNNNLVKLLSNRVFFNGKYPKKKYSLKWCYNKALVVDSLFVNNTPTNVSFSGNLLCYNWEFTNLTGCLDEPESRPYLTLPYFVFCPKPYDMEYTHHDSYKQEFIPSYYFASEKRQMEINVERWDLITGNKNKNNLYYQKLENHIVKLYPTDTIGLLRMLHLQQYMVDSVNYDPAVNYYKQNENHLKQRGGLDLWGHKVKDNNLERIYGNMIPRLGVKMLTAYPVDKRSGEISPQYTATVKDNDLMFAALLNDKSVGVIIPKSDKNNYYFEELPFYYENIPVMLLDISDFGNMRQIGGKRNFNIAFRAWTTPINNYKENYRNTQSKVTINLEDNTSNFQTRVKLSGQYSTLTRFVYNDKSIDSTINSKYHDPIWNIANDIKIESVTASQPLVYYPFKTTITTKYIANNLFSLIDNKYTLKPANLFKMIYTEDLLAAPRYLDYYPDFMGSDKYTYMMEFDKPIKIVSPSVNFNISNRYCHFSFLVKQIDEKRILLNCTYNIISPKIEKDSIYLVKEINQKIIDLNQSEITFEIINSNSNN
ncbi:MAG: hypothetical protein QM503_01400 [Bacteroidota bacterium]